MPLTNLSAPLQLHQLTFSHGFHPEPGELCTTAVFIEAENMHSHFNFPVLTHLGKYVLLPAFVLALLI